LHGIPLNAVLHLKAKFPVFLRTYRQVNIPVDCIQLEFFQEEMAMDCAEKLSGAGIWCMYSMDNARSLSLPLSQDEGEEKISRIVSALENYFQALNFRSHASTEPDNDL